MSSDDKQNDWSQDPLFPELTLPGFRHCSRWPLRAVENPRRK